MPVSARPEPVLAGTVRGVGPGLVLAHGAGGSIALGGPVAIRAAARYSERISALVLTATFAYRDARLDLAAKCGKSCAQTLPASPRPRW